MPSTPYSRLFIALAAIGCAGCATSAADFSVEVWNDCVPHARSVQFSVRYSTWPPAVRNPTALQSISFRVNGVPRAAHVNLAAGRLTLPIDDGTEGVPLGGSIGISGRVPGYFTDLEIEDVAFFADPPGDVAGPPCARSAVPALLASAVTIRGVADWGMHVRHISRSAPDPVQIDTLQWAGSAQALAASNLIWGDPELESLQWQDLVPRGGRRLDGGVDLLCDLPDSALAAYPVWLVRIVSSGPTSSQRGISQLVPNARITPAHKLTWGEIKADYR